MGRSVDVQDLLRFRGVMEPRFSPDGAQILFSLKELGEKNKNRVHLLTVDIATGVQKQWTHGETVNTGARWSPDGRTIAFLRKIGAASQIHLLPVDGGEASPLTSLPEGNLGNLKWSADGRWIAFVFRPRRTEATEEAAKEREKTGASTPPLVTESLFYRMDGDGYFGPERDELWVADITNGACRCLYSGLKMNGLDFDWSPSSDALALTFGDFDQNYHQESANDRLAVVALDGSSREIATPIGEVTTPRWSPDGKWIAYLGYASDVDERGDRNRHAFMVPAEGGEPLCLSAKNDYCLSVGVNSDTKSDDGTFLAWSPDSQAVYVQVGWHGSMQLGYATLHGGGVQLLTSGLHYLGMGGLSPDGSRIAVSYGTPTRLQEIGVLEIGKPTPEVLTDINAELHDEVDFRAPEEHWIDSTDGVKLQVWMIRPAGSGPWPGILEIHGGPHMMYGPTLMHEFQVLAAQGYAVVYTNPRGSKGYGEAHTSAIRGSWGGKDWEDIQTVTAWMQGHPELDADRLGVIGGSYGGYMTNWVIGHTRAFRAAVTDRCVSNLVSKAGNSDYVWRNEGYWPGYAFGFDTIGALWKSSPIAYFDQVQTPTLVIHSEGDLRCNIEQSEQVFAALMARGIPTRFVRYPGNTSHGMSRNGPADLRIHRLGEILAWWKRHLVG